MELTATILRDRLDYDPETGVFTWKPHPGSANAHRAWDAQWAGKPVAVELRPSKTTAGREDAMFRVLGRCYMASRLAWLYMTGDWPKGEVDHKDLDTTNNRFANLREATHGQNQANKKAMKNNRLGVKGVYKRCNKYRAQINVGGKVRHIGAFNCPTAASIAFTKAHRLAHGEFSRTSL